MCHEVVCELKRSAGHMYYLVIRRKIRMTLLFILLAAVLINIAPQVYENIFIQREDFYFYAGQKDLDYGQVWRDTEIDTPVSLDVNLLNDGFLFSKINIDGLVFKGNEFSGDIVIKGRIARDKKGQPTGFSGKLFSGNITQNSEPLLPFRAFFKIANGQLEIEKLLFGRAHKVMGKLSLATPYEVDLRLEIDRLDMRRLSPASRIKDKDIVFGIVSGGFNITGNLAGNIFSEGMIESRRGRFGSVEYNTIRLKLEGFGPIINIVDSSFKHDSGTLTMEGYVDLREISKGGFFDGVRIRSDVKTIVWQGWDITKKGTDELSMEKDIGDKMQVGFKTMAREPLTTYEDRENPEEMSLGYKIGSEQLKMKLRENEEFFVIERNIKF